MGFTHTLFLGIVFTTLIWLWKRNRAFTVGFLLGYAAHALTDVNDCVGTMLLFPFTTLNWTLQTWAYAATIDGGKYLDAAAYYSSLGLGHGPVLAGRRAVLVAGAHPRVLAHAGRARRPAHLGLVRPLLPERGLLALYRATFFYGVCRLIAWSTWAHFVARPVIDGVEHHGYPLDLSWTGPWWLEARSLPPRQPVDRPSGGAGAAGLVYWVIDKLWEPMGRAEARRVAAGVGGG